MISCGALCAAWASESATRSVGRGDAVWQQPRGRSTATTRRARAARDPRSGVVGNAGRAAGGFCIVRARGDVGRRDRSTAIRARGNRAFAFAPRPSRFLQKRELAPEPLRSHRRGGRIMTSTKRWLDELPLGSGERELLLVGKAARPAEGAIDANWQALCAALGTTAISGTFATSAAASSSAAPAAASASAAASAKVGASIAVGKAASAGLFVVAAKSLALGVGIGLALMGAATVVQHSTHSSALPATATKPIPAQPAR